MASSYETILRDHAPDIVYEEPGEHDCRAKKHMTDPERCATVYTRVVRRNGGTYLQYRRGK